MSSYHNPITALTVAVVPEIAVTLARTSGYRSVLVKLSLDAVVASVSVIVPMVSQVVPPLIEPWIKIVAAPAPALVVPHAWYVL
jgi:hypothetical protein